MENNVIYAYKKKDIDKIVYIGQTTDLITRHKQHIFYDPYNVNNREYNYPLSRGVRKYGKDMYELIILEDNIPKEKLNEREQYWIKYYDTYWNGYNQTIGGTYPTQPIFTEEKIDTVIKMLKDESYSYKDIIDKTGISMTHIYNINIGARRKRDDERYPIRENTVVGTRGIIFTKQQVSEIHNLLKNTNLSINNIARQYNCSSDTISRINRGSNKAYKLENWNYPIRDTSNMARFRK